MHTHPPPVCGYSWRGEKSTFTSTSTRRYDLPLKHNGDDAGFLTLLLEAGDSPGEVHALPPPPLPVKAKAPVRGIRVTVLSAEGLPVMDVGGRCDPYVQLVSGSCARRTTTIPQTLQPTWNETLYLATDPKVPVQLVVWDVDEGDEIELVGLAQVSVQDLGVDSWQVCLPGSPKTYPAARPAIWVPHPLCPSNTYKGGGGSSGDTFAFRSDDELFPA